MDANPVLKPRLATPALTLGSAAVSMCAAYLLGTMVFTWPPNSFRLMAWFATLLAAAIAGTAWLARIRRQRAWTAAANERWAEFDATKRAHRTTAEITVLSVDALQPTGSWITIRWNRFDHVQHAWMEAVREPIWPGALLLISPDPAQLRPGAPWPTTYYIQASNCLAWAPPKRDSFRARTNLVADTLS